MVAVEHHCQENSEIYKRFSTITLVTSQILQVNRNVKSTLEERNNAETAAKAAQCMYVMQ